MIEYYDDLEEDEEELDAGQSGQPPIPDIPRDD